MEINPVITTLLLFSLSTVSTAQTVEWNEQEKAILQTLWLGSATQKKDITNSVIGNPVAIDMGHKIFFDQRFSKNGKISCASCHQPDKYFSDGLDTGKGLKKGARNTPTIVGASLNTWFFHDGRHDSLWSQATSPLENPNEHGGNRNQFAHIIYSDPQYSQQYKELFGAIPDITDTKRFPEHAGPVADKKANKNWLKMSEKDRKIVTTILVNIGKVIAAYETTLQPAASRFDRYVNSVIEKNQVDSHSQLTDTELKGLKLFIGKGKCITCHSGSLLTDMGFHNISVQPRIAGKVDWGRYQGAQQVKKNSFNCLSEYNDAPLVNGEKQCDELKFINTSRHETFAAMKTPSLRNVSKTAPYMHAGQYKNLKEVLKHYNDPPPITTRQSELFLNLKLSDEELNQLEAFLHTLDSEIQADQSLLKNPDAQSINK